MVYIYGVYIYTIYIYSILYEASEASLNYLLFYWKFINAKKSATKPLHYLYTILKIHRTEK